MRTNDPWIPLQRSKEDCYLRWDALVQTVLCLNIPYLLFPHGILDQYCAYSVIHTGLALTIET